MYDLDHTINGMIISLVPMCVIVIIELGEHFRIIFVLNQRESWAGRERVDQLVGVRAVSIYIYIFYWRWLVVSILLSLLLCSLTLTPQSGSILICSISGSPVNEFMLNIEDEIALVEAVVDYETLERAVVSWSVRLCGPTRCSAVWCRGTRSGRKR